jgi:prevent-host-death family protein
MKVAKLSDVKDELSRYVDYVRKGGRVRVLVRGLPAADLVPVSQAGPGDPDAADAALAELERQGMVRRGSGRVPPELLKRGPKLRGASMMATVAEDRRSRW